MTVDIRKCKISIIIKYGLLGFKCNTWPVSFCVWAKQTDPTWGSFFFLEIKLLNSVFTHSWHNGTWNVLAELINLVTTFRKITVIALALVLFYQEKMLKDNEILSHSRVYKLIVAWAFYVTNHPVDTRRKSHVFLIFLKLFINMSWNSS